MLSFSVERGLGVKPVVTPPRRGIALNPERKHGLVWICGSLSPEQEVVQDLMTIIHCFSSRLYGLRNYKKSLQATLAERNTT